MRGQTMDVSATKVRRNHKETMAQEAQEAPRSGHYSPTERFALFFTLLLQEEAYRAILEHEAKRVKHLEAKLEQHKERLEAHKHGRNLLSDEEHAKLSHQSTIYARHLKQLESETKEEKMEKVREANEMLQLNHLDRLTF